LDAIEPMRREKLVGSSLEAVVKLRVKAASLVEAANSVDLAEVCIAESVTVTGFADDSVSELRLVEFAGRTTHHKCGRCWRHLPEVSEDGALCSRCDHVVAAMDTAA
jgi:isoleucyl-tRNA synthetase